ncbi:ABC transporter permease [Insolitispirillum peregrinum]|uniref:ABC-2 type transport system permease protein n=1 Tax=Insolitispirillum peregrinum TaxID=80876 RepID=A0A1N7P8Y3_9PROT|nr:ABC transporter permease [Insolitispirillum peregrinum]SIT07043.1 ABC-2 type transport system permease protein [Insolitispirillum peregrinum]
MVDRWFSVRRWLALMLKEFIQMRRDRMTFSMMISVPLMQLALFGFAVNSDPKHLPTAIIDADHGPFSRAVISALEVSGYYRIEAPNVSEQEADRLLSAGSVQFIISFPPDFSRRVARGERPPLLVEADATDPAATSNALGSLSAIIAAALDRDLRGPLAVLKPADQPVSLTLHRRYNPEGVTQYNVVPGLIGVVLSSTMVIMTAMAVTRERERGTMEALLVTPIRPLEMMLGKITPYILIGLVQIAIILLAARLLFTIPLRGDLLLLMVCCLVFIGTNLAIGFIFSIMARTQLQAMQMASSFLMPSILLSGFMFPYRGMPGWAQGLGEVLPLTHFLRIVRGIVLKGNGLPDISHDLLALGVLWLGIALLSLRLYRKTLD